MTATITAGGEPVVPRVAAGPELVSGAGAPVGVLLARAGSSRPPLPQTPSAQAAAIQVMTEGSDAAADLGTMLQAT